MTDAPAGDVLAEWTTLLDRFESDLDSMHDASSEWTPLRTPLPAHLAGRARHLLERQSERMLRLRAELADTKAHLTALDLVPPSSADAPAYVERDA